MKNLLIIFTVIAALAVAQTGVRLVETGTWKEIIVAAAGTSYNSGMTSVPNSDTLLTATTTKVQLIFCSNNTGSAATITITDNAGSPIPYFAAISMAANSATSLHNGPMGMTMAGIRWTQGTSGAIECQIEGVQ